MIRDIRPNEAHQLLTGDQEYVYLDVRTPAEYEAGHPVTARNIPVMLVDTGIGRMIPNDSFLAVVEGNLSKEAKIIVGCKSGGRSARAAKIMADAGYQNLCNMIGGFGGATDENGNVLEPGWAGSGLPIERGEGISYESLRPA